MTDRCWLYRQCREELLEWRWSITSGLLCTTPISIAPLPANRWHDSPPHRLSTERHRGEHGFRHSPQLGEGRVRLRFDPPPFRLGRNCNFSPAVRQQPTTTKRSGAGRPSASYPRTVAGVREDSLLAGEQASRRMLEPLPPEPYWRVAQYADTIENA